MNDSEPDWRRDLPPWLVFVLTFLVFLPSLRDRFVSWDDNVFVLDNKFVGDPTLIFRAPLRQVLINIWHPVTLLANLTYALDYRLWNANPMGFHLTNVVFHSASAALMFFLSRMLLRKRGWSDEGTPLGGPATLGATITAILYSLHPLRVESVTWIAQRKDVIGVFFFLLTLIMYVDYTQRTEKRGRRYLAAVAFYFLALLGKPITITLPVVLIILDYCPLNRLFPEGDGPSFLWIALEKAPFFLLSLAMGSLMLWSKGTAVGPDFQPPFPGFETGITLRLPLFYISKMLWPIHLVPIYPPPIQVFDGFFLASTLFAIAVTAFCLWQAKRERAYLAAWAYFLVALGPISDVAGHFGAYFFATDHYTHLPCMALTLLAGGGIALFLLTMKGARRFAAASVLAVVLMVLSLETVYCQLLWSNSGLLWSHEISIYPQATFAHTNLGFYFCAIGKPQAGLREFKTAAALSPGDPDVHGRLASGYLLVQDVPHAIKELLTVEKMSPNDPNAHEELGMIYTGLLRRQDAVRELSQGALLNPGSSVAFTNLGEALYRVGRRKDAARILLASLTLDPGSAQTHYDLSVAFRALGREQDAQRELYAALRLPGAQGIAKTLETFSLPARRE